MWLWFGEGHPTIPLISGADPSDAYSLSMQQLNKALECKHEVLIACSRCASAYYFHYGFESQCQ